MGISPVQTGVGMKDLRTFGSNVCSTTANVAVAATQPGRRTATTNEVGDYPVGRCVRQQLPVLEVDDRFVVTSTVYNLAQ